MRIKLDFNSPEAIYIQLRNQIVMQIAQEQLHEGDSLPSVRGLAGELGVNMHTVNKAYAMVTCKGFSFRYLQLSANSRWRSDAYCIFITVLL